MDNEVRGRVLAQYAPKFLQKLEEFEKFPYVDMTDYTQYSELSKLMESAKRLLAEYRAEVEKAK